ncbi:MAG: caspase family protein [Sandaracinaceae bacterium]
MTSPVDPSQATAILLGASRFPHARSLDNPAFRGAADALREYLRAPDGLAIPTARTLDLFDSPLDVTAQCHAIQTHLASTRAPATLVIYVGHGGYTREARHYCMMLASSREGLETSTALKLDALVEALGPALSKPLFALLDCCFAAEAVKAFMGPHDELARKQLYELPATGAALLLASSKDDVAFAEPTEGCTRFTTALMDALGDASAGDAVSMRQIVQRVRMISEQRWPTRHARAEVHSPKQGGGVDLADVPFFRVRRRAKAPSPSVVPRPPALGRQQPLAAPTADRRGAVLVFALAVVLAIVSVSIRSMMPSSLSSIAAGVVASAFSLLGWGVLRALRAPRWAPGGVVGEAVLALFAGLAVWIAYETLTP